MCNVIVARWNSDSTPVVLEVQSTTSKSCTDSEPIPLRQLLHEFEEEGLVDTTLHGHELRRPDDVDPSGV